MHIDHGKEISSKGGTKIPGMVKSQHDLKAWYWSRDSPQQA